MHYNTSRVNRFSNLKFKSSLKQGVEMTPKPKTAIKSKKKESSLSISRAKEDKLHDDSETVVESELSSDPGYVQMKSGKYINPIIHKYSSVPHFKL